MISTLFFIRRGTASRWDTPLGKARESSTVGASRLRRRDADEARRHTARRSLRRRRWRRRHSTLYEISSPSPTSYICVCIRLFGRWICVFLQSDVKTKQC